MWERCKGKHEKDVILNAVQAEGEEKLYPLERSSEKIFEKEETRDASFTLTAGGGGKKVEGKTGNSGVRGILLGGRGEKGHGNFPFIKQRRDKKGKRHHFAAPG